MTAGLQTFDRRRPASIEVGSAAKFLRSQLPQLASKNWAMVAPSLEWLCPTPLTVVLNGERFTFSASVEGLSLEEGEASHRDIGTTVEFSEAQILDLAVDQVTPMGLFSSGQLIELNGRLESLLDWWLIIRAVIDDTPVHVPGQMEFTDIDGNDLDLAQRFNIDDDPTVLNRFLDQCGYLHIGSVFDASLMDQVSADMESNAAKYSMGDGKSWWANLADGSDVLVRMQGFDQHSSSAETVLNADAFKKIEAISGHGHHLQGGYNRIEALFKPIGVSQGISDVPWHKDCALGRHHFECCSMTVGISVTGADEGSGQLKVVAGSHRSLVWSSLLREGTELPVVELPTEVGDVTVHLSCTLHMAQPPTTAPRKVMYTSLRLPDFDPAAHEEIGAIREAAAVTVSQPPAHKNK